MSFLVDADPPAWADPYCIVESVRRIEPLNWLTPLLGSCGGMYDPPARQLSTVWERAEIFRLRAKRWPTQQELGDVVFSHATGKPTVVVVVTAGEFGVLHLGADGLPSSRCGFAEDEDVLWSETHRGPR